MIVFHASPYIVKEPDILHSRDYLDFGRGLYLTPIHEQAIKYAERFIRRGQEAFLNEYELTGTHSGYKTLRFDSYTKDWLEFVAANRKENKEHSFDIVFGPVADDKVYNTVDLYLNGLINSDEALNRLKYEQPNSQLCICSQNVIDDCLTFIKAEKLMP